MVSQTALVDTTEQRALRDTVRRLLADKAPLDGPRAEGRGFDRALWRQLAGELGLAALTVPEKYDGLGQTALETHVVFEEMGRALYRGPYLATVSAAVPVLLAAGDESALAELLPPIAAGECIATLAAVDAEASPTTAVQRAGEWRLTGRKGFVLDGADADLLVVTAREQDGNVTLFAVRADAPGLSRSPMTSLDLARSVAGVRLADTPARPVGRPGAAPELVAGALDQLLVAVAAEQAGGMAACLDMAVEYAKTRRQFGRAIGSFQAVAHRCVDMLGQVEFGRAAARYAAAALAEGDAEAPVAARVAAAYCGEAFRNVTVETIQVHGGIGFTWEHDAHLYYRRAWSSQQLFGGLDRHYLEVADRIGL